MKVERELLNKEDTVTYVAGAHINISLYLSWDVPEAKVAMRVRILSQVLNNC